MTPSRARGQVQVAAGCSAVMCVVLIAYDLDTAVPATRGRAGRR
ncbi:hypothetical protein [Streptomyces zagrosensis]|uniref:Uncharacterized protein n=1 Tax=Streptomyces zagrosensis TaxID=1042984 RepID=A0A7W9UZJ1_9ACTN|nr:hypothetical protein [Streptomyces zagrosensis]MBB5936436.1 hypothetical protein [Streptomyces zagrosensis]